MLKKLFCPSSVALIGASATPGKLGFDILSNLVHSDFDGKIYPINPKIDEILGKKTFPSVLKVAEKIDLAIIAVPASVVITVLKECAVKKIQNVVIISAGFKETGKEGAAMEQEIQKIVKKHKMNLVGPNCLGVLNIHKDLNASFAEGMPNKGNIALISQSGAMAVAITDWAYEENIGFSKIVSLGNKAGITENDCLEFLEKDNDTDVIMLYLESFADGKQFMEISKKVALKKPIVLFKSGISDAGIKAVSSHTGALAGSDQAVEAAMNTSGVLRAHTVEDFFDLARALSMQPLPNGTQVAIVTNAGGPGVIATDAIDISEILQMAEFSQKTSHQLASSLPSTANIHNPVDVIGDALSDRYASALSKVCADENVDMVLTILTPQIMTEKEETAEVAIAFNEAYPDKPIFTAFMGGKNIEYAAKKLEENSVPNFLYPTRAVRTFERMAELSKWRKNQNREKNTTQKHPLSSSLRKKIQTEQKKGNLQLSSKIISELLRTYDISLPAALIANSKDEAVQFAERIGYPVVLKIASDEVLHKTDVGGVRLALKNADEVISAFEEININVQKKAPKAQVDGILVQKMYHFGREVIVGMKRDEVFGPLIMFGLGGVYVEAMKDVSFRIAPMDTYEAENMIHEVKAIQLLKGIRGEAPADIARLAQAIVAIAHISIDIPEITELDINPLLVRSQGKGVIALDARFLL